MATLKNKSALTAMSLSVLTIGIVAALWVGRTPHQPTPPPPVSTIAQNARACLLDDSSAAGAAAWRDLQQAAAGIGGVNVQRLSQPQHSSGDSGYINSLIQQHCALIIAIGDDPGQAAAAVAAANPSVGFAVQDAQTVSAPNLKLLGAASDDQAAISDLVKGLKAAPKP
jgi:hypothetical protein